MMSPYLNSEMTMRLSSPWSDSGTSFGQGFRICKATRKTKLHYTHQKRKRQ